MFGATVEEQGWDTTVTAGAAYELLRDATLLVPGLDELELVGGARRAAAGHARQRADRSARASTALVVATGHYRNGILLTPVTADAVADLVTS